jgi:hypothetical protein
MTGVFRIAIRCRAPWLAALLVAALAVGCSPSTRAKVGADLKKAATEQPTWQQQPTTNKPRQYVIVQFSDASLNPSIARVLPGGKIAWVNYAMSYTGAVLFPDSFKDALTCGDPGPRFTKVTGGYQSIPITTTAGEDVSLPCPLKPGEYEYQLLLFGGAFSGDPGSQMYDPDSTMQGKIIVE